MLTEQEILNALTPNQMRRTSIENVRDVLAVLAAHSAGAQEPVAYTTADRLKRIAERDRCSTVWHASIRDEGDIPLYTQPQPMTQTDAARDAKRYQAIRSQVLPFNAYASGNPNWTFPGYGPRGATFDEAIDAEIERGERAKGE